MNNYPSECITLSKGKKEVCLFVEKVTYVKYTYTDLDIEKVIKEGKETIILKSDSEKFEKIFFIPTKDKFFTSLRS